MGQSRQIDSAVLTGSRRARARGDIARRVAPAARLGGRWTAASGRASRAMCVVAIFATVLAWLPAAPAAAQNALGDGRALDNNLNSRSRANVKRNDFRQEIAFRNAIATGNAPNFLSFRGDVGYVAADAFRGELGSNDLFSFRRDSLVSGLAGQGIRGTEALQFQSALTTGSRPPPGLVGNYALLSAGAGQSARRLGEGTGARTGFVDDPASGSVAGGFGAVQRPREGTEDADSRGTLLWSLRSSSTYATNRSLQPVYLGSPAPAPGEQRRGLTASPLQGIRLVPVADLSAPLDDDSDGPAGRSGEDDTDSRVGLSRITNDQIEAGNRAPERVESGNLVERIETRSALTLYDQVVRDLEARMAETTVNADGSISTGQSGGQSRAQSGGQSGTGIGATGGLRTLTEDIRSFLEAPFEVREADAPGATAPEPAEGFIGPGRIGPGGIGPAEDAEVVLPAAETAYLSKQSVELLRSIRDERERLVAAATREGYEVRGTRPDLRTGESLLARERYLDAEKHFAAVLSGRPGDVTASIGRLHARRSARGRL
ncbi:MAG: hypothetical protein AAF235_09730 [Planctomycetota bacterium]